MIIMAPRQRFPQQASSYEPDSAESTALVNEKVKRSSTLNQTEADIARDWHDYFNLISLILIVATTAINYDFEPLLKLEKYSLTWTDNYFWLNWATTLIYFFVDLTWVARVPICVKSPGVIIKHHFVAMLYLIGPVYYPEYRWFMGAILSVEVNTWFLILRRVVHKSNQPINLLLSKTVSGCFYFTWITIRCIIYPGILWSFLKIAVERIQETGTYFHLPMVFIPVHFALCLLNLKWTYDLFKPIVRRWLGVGPKPMVVQNGL